MSYDFTEKLTRLEEIQQAVQSDITSVNSRVNKVELDQRAINDAVRRMQMDFITVNEWIRKIVDRERQNSQT